jgi:hypothetical protein
MDLTAGLETVILYNSVLQILCFIGIFIWMIVKLNDPSIDDDATTKKYVNNAVQGVKERTPVITGMLDMRLNNIINVREPSNRSDATTKNYVDRSTSGNVKLDGSSTVMGGSLNMGRNTITNLEDPSDAHDAVNKQYGDSNYVNISNFRSRLIGSGSGRPAAPGIFEILIPATKPISRTVKLVIFFQANNIFRENIDDDAASDSIAPGTTPVIRHKTVAIVDIHGNDDGHIKQYIGLITENGSRYLRMGYTSSKSNPNIMNINFVLLSQNSDRVNINRISVEAYNLV